MIAVVCTHNYVHHNDGACSVHICGLVTGMHVRKWKAPGIALAESREGPGPGALS